MAIQYDYIEEILPHDIFFITTQELEDMFPDYTPKEREYYIAQAKGAVCIFTDWRPLSLPATATTVVHRTMMTGP